MKVNTFLYKIFSIVKKLYKYKGEYKRFHIISIMFESCIRKQNYMYLDFDFHYELGIVIDRYFNFLEHPIDWQSGKTRYINPCFYSGYIDDDKVPVFVNNLQDFIMNTHLKDSHKDYICGYIQSQFI